MTTAGGLPENTMRIDGDEVFSFACHPQVPCFTECCRLLELALTPYDVLRLRKATGLTSEELLARYIIIEQEPGEAFPRLYLTMVDDGRDSCIFVDKDGCSIYAHRPGACRTYPLGRGTTRSDTGTKEHFVLMKEHHCQGFLEPVQQTPRTYSCDQELTVYNQFNDAVLEILQHPTIRDGLVPSHKDIELFLLALYNLDSFRILLFAGHFNDSILSEKQKNHLKSDENLLSFGIEYLLKHIFIPFIDNGWRRRLC